MEEWKIIPGFSKYSCSKSGKIRNNKTLRILHFKKPSGYVRLHIIDDNMKWMVFKVKQKAEWSYWRKTFSTKDDDRFQFDFQGNDILKRPEYSYNWPYDYFSILDMAKIEANVHIESTEARDFRRLQNQLLDLPTKPAELLEEKVLRNFSEITGGRPLFLNNTEPLVPLVPILEFPEATIVVRTPSLPPSKKRGRIATRAPADQIRKK